MNTSQLLQVVLSLLFVVGLLLLAAWVARRSGWLRQRLSHADLRVLGTLRLGARSSVALIEVQGQRLVVGVTPQQITLLQALSQPTASTTFSEALTRATDPS